jgi:hypothetical protein
MPWLRMQFISELIAGYLVGLVGQSDDAVPRTLLGWLKVGLLAGLIGQIAYLIYICFAWPVPTLLWGSILASIAALFVLRRTMRWRYPA